MDLHINGRTYTVHCDSSEMLVWILRDDLGLTGTKMGCGAGICGSCTIHINGVPVRSCVTPVGAALGQIITTIEGLAQLGEDGTEILHPVQQAFIDEQVPQCAWCISGQIMTAAALLRDNPSPTDDEIDNALASNYCRCGCYVRIRSAVRRAAEYMRAHV
ncbi:MAG: (2Fe-2S)-binding protein [Bacteroidota bacterium]|nr:(2Fe-2S)-binding protein [Candidatus Kapabacteria bacterium]MDW8219038.1 (2Fe-2S)-binding protein [Bacteroidota bacterium]